MLKHNKKSSKINKIESQSYYNFLSPEPYNDYLYPRLVLFNQNERGFSGIKVQINKIGIPYFSFYRT